MLNQIHTLHNRIEESLSLLVGQDCDPVIPENVRLILSDVNCSLTAALLECEPWDVTQTDYLSTIRTIESDD